MTPAKSAGPASDVPVLLVDDDAGKRLALRAILAPLGCAIVEADSGQAALRSLMTQDFAVILLDVRMPDMDGFETAALMRLRRQSEMTPIIFITAYASEELVETDRYAEGAVDFMFAPVQPDELRAKVSVFANLFVRARELADRAAEVQASADHLRILTDAAPIGIFETDASNRYVYTNPRWSEITGVSSEEAAGRFWRTLIGSEVGNDAGPVRDGHEVSGRYELSRPGGVRILLVTAKAVRGPAGSISGWVGTLADVTAEAGAEVAMSDARDEATHASRLKSDFLANMSHEIRTPMNGVIGMTDLLLETDLDGRQRDYAQTLRNSGEALLTIIDDILDFSKIEAGKLDVEAVAFSPRVVLGEVVDLLAGSAQAKGLELLAAVGEGVPGVVVGDPGRARQVLTNLIGNAIKFTHHGEVVVRMQPGPVAGDRTLLRFSITDTGDGIADHDIDAIFSPFVQADTSTSRRYGGTGLGLTISCQLVTLMGGACGVASELGVGSEFWFTIDVLVVDADPDPDPEAGDADLVGIHVLVVDDSAAHRSTLSQVLTSWGLRVTVADSGQAALATLRTATIHGRPFAVALVDRSMPGMDGRELQHAMSADPAIDARVVLMTALAGDRGAPSTLHKPIRGADLHRCLRRVLDLPMVLEDVPTPVAPEPGSPRRGRLLVAEDNLINQKVAVAILTGAGYVVDTVLNGAAAVGAAITGSYDAILMDCQMPELNGFEATAAIRSGPAASTPIIAMTAGARPEDRTQCLAAGMDGYLSKPVSKDNLLAVVARYVRTVTPAVPVIDPRIFEDLQALDQATRHDFLARIVRQFEHDTAGLLVELRAALSAADADAVARIAHHVKGTGAQLGGRRLASSCTALVRKAIAGTISGAEDELALVEAAYEELRRAWAERLGEHAPEETSIHV